MTGLRSLTGSRVPSHGLAMIFRSRTADRMAAETRLWTTAIVAGASALRPIRLSEVPSSFTQACTSDGRIVEICRAPSVG